LLLNNEVWQAATNELGRHVLQNLPAETDDKIPRNLHKSVGEKKLTSCRNMNYHHRQENLCNVLTYNSPTFFILWALHLQDNAIEFKSTVDWK
jgi:hypothetical protein